MANTELAIHINPGDDDIVWTDIEVFREHENPIDDFSTLRIKIGNASMLVYFHGNNAGADRVAKEIINGLKDELPID